jgi:hypothetical protein
MEGDKEALVRNTINPQSTLHMRGRVIRKRWTEAQ